MNRDRLLMAVLAMMIAGTAFLEAQAGEWIFVAVLVWATILVFGDDLT